MTFTRGHSTQHQQCTSNRSPLYSDHATTQSTAGLHKYLNDKQTILFVTIDARRCAEFPDDSLRFYMFREIPSRFSRFSKFVVTLHDHTFTRSAHTTWNRIMNLLILYCNLTLMTLMASVYKTQLLLQDLLI